MTHVLERPAPWSPESEHPEAGQPSGAQKVVPPVRIPLGIRRRRSLPAAYAWQDASLPVVGRVHASGWLPLALLTACSVALVYLVQTSGVATTGYDIQRLQAERSDWTLMNEQLRLELAKRRSLTWVESEAVNRLGMQRPDGVTYLRANQP